MQVNSTDPGPECKADLGISIQNTPKGLAGTVHSPHISAFCISFLCQSQMDSPTAKATLTPSFLAEKKRTLFGLEDFLLSQSSANTSAPPVDPGISSPTRSPHITLTYDFMTGKTLLLAHLCPHLQGLSGDLPPFPPPVHSLSLYLSNAALGREQGARW